MLTRELPHCPECGNPVRMILWTKGDIAPSTDHHEFPSCPWEPTMGDWDGISDEE